MNVSGVCTHTRAQIRWHFNVYFHQGLWASNRCVKRFRVRANCLFYLFACVFVCVKVSAHAFEAVLFTRQILTPLPERIGSQRIGRKDIYLCMCVFDCALGWWWRTKDTESVWRRAKTRWENWFSKHLFQVMSTAPRQCVSRVTSSVPYAIVCGSVMFLWRRKRLANNAGEYRSNYISSC